MEVTFLRHGIAVDRSDPLCPPDIDRPLTLDGKNRTEGVARGLKAIGLRPRIILTSPYLRCVQTARVTAQVLGLTKQDVLPIECLSPEGDPRALWPEVAATGDGPVLCIGHGGSIEPAAGIAVGLPTRTVDNPDGPDFAFRSFHLKKAGAMQLEVDFEPELSAKLSWLMSPKLLRQLGRS